MNCIEVDMMMDDMTVTDRLFNVITGLQIRVEKLEKYAKKQDEINSNNKTLGMNFAEACDAMIKGSKVRCKSWLNDEYFMQADTNTEIVDPDKLTASFCIKDFYKTDWEIVP